MKAQHEHTIHIWHHRGLRLELRPSTRARHAQTTWLAYRLVDEAWAASTGGDPVVFTGDDLGVLTPTASGTTADPGPDRDAFALGTAALCAYFAQLPGDIDDDYFSRYSPQQMAWRDARAHLLDLPETTTPA